MDFFSQEICEKITGAKEEDLEALHRVLFLENWSCNTKEKKSCTF
jgi:hypothetical protein